MTQSSSNVPLTTLDLLQDDFKLFLQALWEQLDLPSPTRAQYHIADYLQHGPKRLGKIGSEVLDPCNLSGDHEGSKRLDTGEVKTPQGYKEAYQSLRDGGWFGLEAKEQYGGQQIPVTLSTAVNEIWHSSNVLAFSNLSPKNSSVPSVITAEGATALTRMWSGPSSRAIPRVIPITAAFEAT